MCGENFYIHGSQIPRKCIDLRHFCLFPTQSLPSSFCHQALGSRKLLVTQAAFFRESAERGGENYDLLDQNFFRKYEADLEHNLFYILHDLQFFQIKCDGFTVF